MLFCVHTFITCIIPLNVWTNFFFFFCSPDISFFSLKKIPVSICTAGQFQRGRHRRMPQWMALWQHGNALQTRVVQKSTVLTETQKTKTRKRPKKKKKIVLAVKFWTIKVTHYMIFLVVYIYHKCTKTLINTDPSGWNNTHHTTNQRKTFLTNYGGVESK